MHNCNEACAEIRFFDESYTTDLLINRRRKNWGAESEI